MAARRLIRMLYTWLSGVDILQRAVQALRSHPRVRAFARRHVGVLLARGTTWANVDGALRLLAEARDQRVVFGPWHGDLATELLYWAPFVRWAQDQFALDPERVAVVSQSGAGSWYGDACSLPADQDRGREGRREMVFFPPDPVLALVGEYRTGSAPPRPLLKRSRHVLLRPSDEGRAAGQYLVADLGPSAAFPASDSNRQLAERLLDSLSASREVVVLDRTEPASEQHALIAGAAGMVATYSGLALLGAFSGVPVVALHAAGGEVSEPDLDLAVRVTSALGGSLTVLDAAGAMLLCAALGGR
jgi:hypothetical protein